jgi:two-component system LytT family sensor kinase
LKIRSILYHLLFWGAIYLFWIVVFRSYSVAVTRTMTIEFCYLLFITADYYAINDWVVPTFLLRKKYVAFVLAVLLVIAVSAGLRAIVALKMNQYFFNPAPAIDFMALYLRSAINISLWILLVTLGKMLVDRMQTQQQLESLEKERIKSELDYLKAQINPHALFNSLNTIYGHIDKHNHVARNILLQFSELLRYQLYDCTAEKVCLQKEIAYIQNYVAFQRLRKDEKLIVTFEMGPIGPGLKIAPLLLIVLIENAFKFVSNFAERKNKICIEIYTNNNVLYSSILNTKEVQPAGGPMNSNGIGVANLLRRLELLYPKKYELAVNDDYDRYETNLTIDLT